MFPGSLFNLALGGGASGGGASGLDLAGTPQSTNSTSAAFAITGTYAAGDDIVILLGRPGSLPATPPGYASFATITHGTGDASIRAVRKVAASASETVDLSGTIGNKAIFVFTGTNDTNPIGDTDPNSGGSRTATIDNLGLAASTSYVLAMVQTASLNSDGAAAQTPSSPSGMTSVGSGSGSAHGGHRAAYVGPTGVFGAKSVTVETRAGPNPGDPDPTIRWTSLSVEFLAA